MCLIANWKVKNKTNIFKADRVRIWLFRSTSSSLPLKPQGHEREKKGGRRRGGKKRDSFPETALKSSQLRKWLDGQRSVARKALTWQKPLNKKKGFAVCVCVLVQETPLEAKQKEIKAPTSFSFSLFLRIVSFFSGFLFRDGTQLQMFKFSLRSPSFDSWSISVSRQT